MIPNPQMRTHQSRSVRRTGAAGFMLVLILTLLVGTFSLSLTRRINDERRMDVQRQTVTDLLSAIDAVKASELKGEQTIRLPLDRDNQRWILVEIIDTDDQTPVYRGTLYHRDRPGLSVTRPTTTGS